MRACHSPIDDGGPASRSNSPADPRRNSTRWFSVSATMSHELTSASRFEAAFELHHRRVLAYAIRRTRSLVDAEDAVAETFAVAWRRIDQLPAGDGELPWLLGTARRILANQHRGARRLGALLDRLRAQPQAPRCVAPTPESPAIDALARLRPDDQELLRLIAWEDLSHADAAAVLGISVNAVAIRLHRARARFAQALVKGSGPSRTSALVKDSTAREPNA